MTKNKNSAFTLMELIVSVAVVAILAAGLFAVGNYIDTQMKIKRTQATMELLITALEQYHDFYHEFPDVNTPAVQVGEYPAGCDNDANDIERLYYKLTLSPDVRKVLDQIERKAIKDGTKNVPNDKPDKNPEIADAWNQNFRYKYEEGWNFPEIISAGPDKDFKKDKDNINSKKL